MCSHNRRLRLLCNYAHAGLAGEPGNGLPNLLPADICGRYLEYLKLEVASDINY